MPGRTREGLRADSVGRLTANGEWLTVRPRGALSLGPQPFALYAPAFRSNSKEDEPLSYRGARTALKAIERFGYALLHLRATA